MFKWIYSLRVLIVFCFVIVLGAMLSCEQEAKQEMPAQVDFNFHIKPILVQKCYLCHGPDPSSREAGLRLDLEEGATMLLESGNRAIVPESVHNATSFLETNPF